MLCFDSPENAIVLQLLEKVRTGLRELGTGLCPEFSFEKNVKLFTGRDLLEKVKEMERIGKTPYTRLGEAIELVIQQAVEKVLRLSTQR